MVGAALSGSSDTGGDDGGGVEFEAGLGEVRDERFEWGPNRR